MDNQIGVKEVVYGVMGLIVIIGAVFYDAQESQPVSLGGDVQAVAVAVSDVTTAEDAYFQKTGNYLQVKADGTTPDGKVATDELKIAVVDYEIHTYITPKGEKGYYILTDTPDGKAIIDHGNGGFSFTPAPPVIEPPSTTTIP